MDTSTLMISPSFKTTSSDGDPVAHLGVNGGADAFGEALIAQRSRDPSVLCCIIIHPLVDLRRCDPGPDPLCHVVQHRHIELSALPDPLDLLRRFYDLVGRHLMSHEPGPAHLPVEFLVALAVGLSAPAPAWVSASDSL